ncbi:MAG: DUF6020 family protein [Solobacterium sp.]|jgi:hypothetical protein|nr:DUF6020 family protein [Solobacterium sp.]MCH4266334.1 DUF6020 family protein [Solobacterium sp.]
MKANELKNRWFGVLFALLLSASITVGRKIVFSGDVADGKEANYLKPMNWMDLLIFILLATAIYFAIMLISEYHQRLLDILFKGHRFSAHGKYQTLIISVLLLAAWSPYLLSLAPGSVTGDTMSSIWQVFEDSVELNNHMPVLYTLFLGGLIKLGLAVRGTFNAGIYFYTFIQTAIMIATIVSLVRYLIERETPAWMVVVTMAWFMFMPLFPDYALVLWKDPIFSCALIWITILIARLVEDHALISRRSWVWKFSLACLVAAFTRNNGIYVVIALLICVILIVHLYSRRLILSAICICCIYYGITGPVYSMFGIENEFAESVGIELQSAAAVINEGGVLSESDEEVLYTLLPEENWKEDYEPCLVDSIKWDSAFNQEYLEANKRTFLKTVLHVVSENPGICLKQYVMSTFGYWKIGVQNDYGYIDTEFQEYYGMHRTDWFAKLFGTSIQSEVSGFRVYIGTGTLFWLIAAGMMILVMDRRRRHGWLICIPAMAVFLTVMIAAPVSFSLRYVYVFALGLPLYLILPLLQCRTSEVQQKEREQS